MEPEKPPLDEDLLARAIEEDEAEVAWEPPRPWMPAFLTALERTGNIAGSCRVSNISDESVRLWRQRDEKFAIAVANAIRRSGEFLEETARLWATRGIEDVEETVQTRPDGTVVRTTKTTRHRSPATLIFLLKGAMPEKYRDNVRVEQTGANGGPIKHEVEVVEQAVEEFAAELERLGGS